MLILTCIALCECLNIYHVIILQASCIRCLLKCMSIQLIKELRFFYRKYKFFTETYASSKDTGSNSISL